jgi:hypothetical protein
MKKLLSAVSLALLLSTSVVAGEIEQPPAPAPCNPTVQQCTQGASLESGSLNTLNLIEIIIVGIGTVL